MTANNRQEENLEPARRGRKPRDRVKTSIGISPEGYVLWNKTAAKKGLNAIMGLELAVREWAEQNGVVATPEEIEQAKAHGQKQKAAA